jgi:hypothetical protein
MNAKPLSEPVIEHMVLTILQRIKLRLESQQLLDLQLRPLWRKLTSKARHNKEIRRTKPHRMRLD